MTGFVARIRNSPSEPDDPPLALVHVLRAPDVDGLVDRRGDRAPLVLEVVPEEEVIGRRFVDELGRLRDPGGHRRTLLGGRLRHPEPRVREHPAAAVAIEAAGRARRQLVPTDVERRQVVPLVGVAEVRRPLQEERPAAHPQPELAFLVRVEGQLVGLRRVAPEEARLRLADVHHVEERRVGEELDVLVRARASPWPRTGRRPCPRTGASARGTSSFPPKPRSTAASSSDTTSKPVGSSFRRGRSRSSSGRSRAPPSRPRTG
jgi:hypothetical protein